MDVRYNITQPTDTSKIGNLSLLWGQNEKIVTIFRLYRGDKYLPSNS